MDLRRVSQTGLSRRGFLTMGGVAAATAFVACAPKPNLTQAPASAPTSSSASSPAASGASSSGGTTELVYWSFMPTKTRFPGRPELFAEFEKKNNAKITITDVDFATMSEKFLASAAARQVPDLIDPGISEMAISWGKAGLVMDMSETVKTLGESDFFPNFVRALNCGGKIYGVPYLVPVMVLWYRKDLFSDQGIKVPATWDEWLTAAQKLHGTKDPTTKKTLSGVSGYLSQTHAHAYWQSMIGPNNGITFDKNWKVVVNTTPQNLHAMEFMLKLSPYFQPGAVNANYGDTANLFMDGTLAMTMSTTTTANGIAKAHPDMVPKAGTTLLPFGPDSDKTRGGMDDPYSWVVPVQAKNRDLATKFVQWFMTPSTYIQAFKTVDYGHVPVLQSTLADPQLKKILPEFAYGVVSTGVEANKIGTQPGEDYGPNPLANLITSTGTWSKFLQRVYNKTNTPQGGLDWLAQQINQLAQDNPKQLGC